MKNCKGMIGLGLCLICLWAVVVTTYASQMGNPALGKAAGLLALQTPTSCSSSSSSSSGE